MEHDVPLMNDPADRTDASSAADDRVAGEAERDGGRAFDFTFAPGVARIAIYDDLLSAPHMIEIPPAETGAYIENIASTIYEQARRAGGVIPYFEILPFESLRWLVLAVFAGAGALVGIGGSVTSIRKFMDV